MSRLLGVEVLFKLGRALDIREQRRDGLAFAVVFPHSYGAIDLRLMMLELFGAHSHSQSRYKCLRVARLTQVL